MLGQKMIAEDWNQESYQRVTKVRDDLMRTVPSICPERALLITESFRETEGEPMIIRRAKALAQILNGMSIYIEEDQLIVGNQASAGRAAPIFPEYSIAWVIAELDQFERRTGDVFTISDETKRKLRDIYGDWRGRTHQDEVLRNISAINKLAEEQNVIHRGGISMSGDGHIIPNHDKLLAQGYGGVMRQAQAKLGNGDLEPSQRHFYQASVIALQAASQFVRRYAQKALELAKTATNPHRQRELAQIAEICAGGLEKAPQSFHEALLLVYFTHLVMMIESNGHSFSFGRFDQYMYPFYQRDIERGVLTDEQALELIALFFIKLNSLNKVRPWDHTEFGVGYPLYSNLMVGGMKADGSDGTNELSYLCLRAMALSRLPEPNLSVRYWEGTPKELLWEAARLIRERFGMPSLFADETVIATLRSIGIPETVARDYASMGCVEVAIPGRWGHRATGMTYMNFGKILELLLNNGVDPRTGIQLISVNGRKESQVDFGSYEELWEGWRKFLKFYTDLAVESDYVCDRSLKLFDADPFASSLIDCCIERGKTLKEGGAEYDFVSHSTIGTTVVGDSLAALKKLVFDDQLVTFPELKAALDQNWQGEKNARIRRLALNAPKFGNDRDEADRIVADVYRSYLDLLPSYRNERDGSGPIGCGYTMSTSNISSYVPYGMDVGATPDGRLAGKPLNEGASPCLGADREGPTAVAKSVSKLPNSRMAGGQLLNMKFSPEALADDGNLDKFVSFIEASRRLGNFHLQFNVVDSATLRAARRNPEQYPNLMVRVAGYCALFTSLIPEVQEAIIERTEHHGF
ncbi:formate C-acetyltransferase [Hydrogenispora ethanolica]|uniref:Formate C-acetyltransferase n=1 Tax=Hydrogenispora ethanolica TaxID=1082276 RepID=A0A4R1RAN0_HYDET|nr:formate C-acetyltransferase/glycerol dehydratase family glycyl radical enzyme [Hydrogenispora ethanolica]TCL62795.1 formate C-acetyltransferase [Hydrogenispora ethanolica]